MLKNVNLQLLADGVGDSGAEGQEAGQQQQQEPKEQKQKEQKPISFDEFLADPKNQSIFDKRVNKAIETAKEKWEEEEKLSAEELANKKLSDREKAVEKREKAQDLREYTASIKEELIKNELPTEFAELIANSTKENEADEVISGIKKLWDEKITEQIKAAARQKDPVESGALGQTPNSQNGLLAFARENRKVR